MRSTCGMSLLASTGLSLLASIRFVIIGKYPVCHYWQVPGLRGTTGVGAPVIELAAET